MARNTNRQGAGQPDAERVGRCRVMFEGGGQCEKDADHRAGRWSDDPHVPGTTPAAGQQPAAVEETHVVADDSDDPEHVDDCPCCGAFTLTGHRAVGQQPTQQPATEPLIDAERQFLAFALDLASDRMANRSDEFEDEDWTILARLRRLADGGA